MKPIGTVTKYYPLVDDETRNALESLMNESENYYDFLVQLGDKVCSEDVPLSLAFLAAVLSWPARIEETEERIAEKYNDTPIIRPWTFTRMSPLEGARLQTKMVEALDDAISSNPEDWILMHLLFRSITVTAATPRSIEAYAAVRKLVEETPRLDGFKTDILHAEGRFKDIEGDTRGALEIYQGVLKLAREQDDQRLVVTLLNDIGKRIALTDFQRGMELIDEAYSISKHLGVPSIVRGTLGSMSSISHKIGEYDLALKSMFDAVEERTAARFTDSHLPLDVSMIYSDIGDGKEALTWALMFDDPENKTGHPSLSVHGCPDITMARALLLLKRTSEAAKHIDSLRGIAFKSGWEPWLAGYYLVSGQYEVAVGEVANGMQLIERALEVYERLDMQTSINRSLIALTKAEILAYKTDEDTPDPRDSGPWMIRLEEEATEKRLTGILMQHAMLKAEFRMKLKQIDAAREILESALEISDQPTVKSLSAQIADRLRELERVSLSK
jgi:tetratricopeptide (TPR) repeat protein